MKRCPCNTGQMIPDHILQTCPNYNDLRARTWPTDATLQTKLYGSPEDLRKTAAFVQETGVDIWMRRTRKKKKHADILQRNISQPFSSVHTLAPHREPWLPKSRIDILKTSLSTSGASLWNTIPPLLTSCNSLSSFKAHLHKWIKGRMKHVETS